MEYILMDASHVDAVAELEKVCFHDPWSANSITAELNNPLSLWIVAVEGDQLAGYVGSQSVMGWADMMNIAVAPSFRRQGVAENMISQLIARLMENTVSCLTLEVRASNDPAILLYQKLGFQQVGRRPNYYRNPKEDALIMRKEWEV